MQEANQSLCFSTGKDEKEGKPEVCPCDTIAQVNLSVHWRKPEVP